MFDEIHRFLDTPKIPEGLNQLGSGCWGEVYDSDSFIPDTVVKYGCTTGEIPTYGMSGELFGDGWLLYALFCMKQSVRKSWMPQIHALHIDWKTKTFHAVIEKLKTKPYVNGPTPSVCGYAKELDSMFEQKINCYPEFKDVFSSVLKDMKFLVSKLPEGYIFFDAHKYNWMWRGDELVLIDPFTIMRSILSNNNKLKVYNDFLKEYGYGVKNVVIVY